MSVTQRFRRDIEGLRALAILMVVLYHAGYMKGGFIGVDVFFVLSGYLITGLLIKEHATTNTINYASFVGRRMRRLIPAASVTVMVTAAAGFFVFSPTEHRTLIISGVSSVLYVANAYFAKNSLDYLGSAGETNPFLHMWSLSVEEQFYLVWPIVMLLCMGIGMRRNQLEVKWKLLFSVMFMLTVASFVANLILTEWRQPWAFFLPFTRAWEFGLGGLLALMPGITKRGNRLVPVVGWAGFVILVASAWLYSSSLAFPGWWALIPSLGTLMILLPGHLRLNVGLGALLEGRGAQWIGARSYSWYLWHWPALVFLRQVVGEPGAFWTVVCVVGSLVVADASFRWIETPFRRVASTPLKSVGYGSAFIVVSLAVMGGWAVGTQRILASGPLVAFSDRKGMEALQSQNGCHQGQSDTSAVSCEYGKRSSPTMTVVLLGDSHASNWFTVIHEAALVNGWRLLTFTKSSCGPAAVKEQVLPALKRAYIECEAWREDAFDRIQKTSPDVVITVGYLGMIGDHFSYEDWLEGTRATFETLSASAEKVIHILDASPPGFDALACNARQRWLLANDAVETCRYDKSPDYAARHAIETRLALEFTNVTILDATHLICASESDCPTTTRDASGRVIPIWSDEHHITRQYMDTIADDFEVLLLVALEDER